MARRGLAQAAEREEDRGQALLRAVVEVALDPMPLGVGDLDEPRARGAQLRFRPLSLGDVPEVRGEGRRPGKPDLRDRELHRELGAVLVQGGQLEPPIQH